MKSDCLYYSPRKFSKVSIIIWDDNFAHQSPFPSLNLSSRCSNLSRGLSPGHANKSAGFCSGVFGEEGNFWNSQVYFDIRRTTITSASIWKTRLRSACLQSITPAHTKKWHICLTFTLSQSSLSCSIIIQTTLVISDDFSFASLLSRLVSVAALLRLLRLYSLFLRPYSPFLSHVLTLAYNNKLFFNIPRRY
jgi:hypothetical protein